MGSNPIRPNKKKESAMLRISFEPTKDSFSEVKSVVHEYPDVNGQESLYELKEMFRTFLIGMTFDASMVNHELGMNESDWDDDWDDAPYHDDCKDCDAGLQGEECATCAVMQDLAQADDDLNKMEIAEEQMKESEENRT
jgi:hypothetical protein